MGSDARVGTPRSRTGRLSTASRPVLPSWLSGIRASPNTIPARYRVAADKGALTFLWRRETQDGQHGIEGGGQSWKIGASPLV